MIAPTCTSLTGLTKNDAKAVDCVDRPLYFG